MTLTPTPKGDARHRGLGGRLRRLEAQDADGVDGEGGRRAAEDRGRDREFREVQCSSEQLRIAEPRSELL